MEVYMEDGGAEDTKYPVLNSIFEWKCQKTQLKLQVKQFDCVREFPIFFFWSPSIVILLFFL